MGCGGEAVRSLWTATELRLEKFSRKSRSCYRLATAAVFCLQALSGAGEAAAAPTDPGVRGGAPAAGGPISGVTSDELTYFQDGLASFLQAKMLADGLGPRFNLDSCGGCHAQPAAGGSSPAANPQPTVATAYGAKNTVPSFVKPDGPVFAAHFKTFPDGSPDGQVHALFVISGRVDFSDDASGCTAVQENFNQQYSNGNLALRVPSPMFGGGLLQAVSDSALKANLAANAQAKTQAGIAGRFNINPNGGSIMRFGWKAQIPSLLVFAGEAHNDEMGISNEIFPIEHDENPTCQFAPVPNDLTVVDGFENLTPPLAVSLVQQTALFMDFLAPPTPSTTTPGGSASIARGSETFVSTGCALCHTPSLTTQASTAVPALQSVTVNLFSDIALHKMGPGLADGLAQGSAAGDEFRTAPLWGLGQRIFFLHDGRTKDLLAAIAAHASPAGGGYGPSEANAVISAFESLPPSQKQDLLNFLRSL